MPPASRRIVLDLGSFVRGRYLHALGNVMSTMGNQDNSLSYHREALQHYKATLGNNHHRTTDLALLDHALNVYSNGNMYAPEKARATFLRSRAFRKLNETDKAEADVEEAAAQYLEIVGRDVGATEGGIEKLGRGLKQDDFDSLIAFWSR
ncbi:hypothetical protein N0V93_009830 [Gnomoniopsis smithogilvyi]|uniref:Uncharacterized protein n=1 Tax=Gnomoniopsis smithogilvyi TaxID=1191159 RepID=A0A9W8YIN6_9PEZI|nr:hypothetical protein N0V93_009830 [Gnomoniopsis smithogilvyi]